MSCNTLNSSNQHKNRRYKYVKNPQCQNGDVSQHLKSLQARLGFARFKLNQGWEKATIFDVEQLWRQRQQTNINNIPRPRFTQREVIDKRMYIPSPGARQARTKRDDLVRKISTEKKNQKQICPTKATSSSTDDFEMTLSYFDKKISHARNSLDYLSDTIEMTEQKRKKKSNSSDAAAAFMISSQPLPLVVALESPIYNKISPPSSPTTSAAKAIMMFLNK